MQLERSENLFDVSCEESELSILEAQKEIHDPGDTGNDMSWTEKTIHKRMGVCVLGIRERTRPFFNISYFLV